MTERESSLGIRERRVTLKQKGGGGTCPQTRISPVSPLLQPYLTSLLDFCSCGRGDGWRGVRRVKRHGWRTRAYAARRWNGANEWREGAESNDRHGTQPLDSKGAEKNDRHGTQPWMLDGASRALVASCVQVQCTARANFKVSNLTSKRRGLCETVRRRNDPTRSWEHS